MGGLEKTRIQVTTDSESDRGGSDTEPEGRRLRRRARPGRDYHRDRPAASARAKPGARQLTRTRRLGSDRPSPSPGRPG